MKRLLEKAEADDICGAGRYERSPDRLDTRFGSYPRKLLTGAGELELKVSRLRSLPFETQIIERYKRRESSSVLVAIGQPRRLPRNPGRGRGIARG